MITATGVHIQKVGGVEGTPTMLDIAIQSGRICRFAGAIWNPLLTHLIFVGLMAYKRTHEPGAMLWGFLHDAHEIVTGEVPRPFKCDCMRTEQSHLDDKIIKMFRRVFIDRHGDITINWDLTKQCDVDACDIEAHVLGLPGYREITMAHGQAYSKWRDEPYKARHDIDLFERILASPFYRDTISMDKPTESVLHFAYALETAAAGKMERFEELVASWGLM